MNRQPPRRPAPGAQRGIALLAVLVLVLVMSVLVVGLLDDVRFALRRSDNAQSVAQARWHALASETVATGQLLAMHRADPQRTTLAGDWDRQALAVPLEQGLLQARLSDATHCFNLNSVVQGTGHVVTRREGGVRQYLALLQALGIEQARANALADTLVDWLDSDQQPQPQGHEDASYRAGPGGYLTGSTWLAEVSELRALRGYDDATYQRLRPWVCVLPDNRPMPHNPNTLRPEQALVLTVLTAGALDEDAARRLLAQRPAGGWPDIAGFWREPALQALALDNSILAQADIRTRYFRLHSRVASGSAQVILESLLQLDNDGHARLLARQWNFAE